MRFRCLKRVAIRSALLIDWSLDTSNKEMHISPKACCRRHLVIRKRTLQFSEIKYLEPDDDHDCEKYSYESYKYDQEQSKFHPRTSLVLHPTTPLDRGLC